MRNKKKTKRKRQSISDKEETVEEDNSKKEVKQQSKTRGEEEAKRSDFQIISVEQNTDDWNSNFNDEKENVLLLNNAGVFNTPSQSNSQNK